MLSCNPWFYTLLQHREYTLFQGRLRIPILDFFRAEQFRAAGSGHRATSVDARCSLLNSFSPPTDHWPPPRQTPPRAGSFRPSYANESLYCSVTVFFPLVTIDECFGLLSIVENSLA